MNAAWTGIMRLGLIHIPVSLYGATRRRPLRLSLVERGTQCPIGLVRVCRRDGHRVEPQNVVRAYEYAKGKYVELEEEDFRRADALRTKTIDVLHFVEAKEIDPIHFKKPYYVQPHREAERAYVLLREALQQTKRVGIVTFIMRRREYLGMLKCEGDALMLHQMRFESEIRTPEDLSIPVAASFYQDELDMTTSLIERMSVRFDTARYLDTYTQQLREVIEHKIRGEEVADRGEEPEPTPARELTEAIRKSLAWVTR